MELGVPSSLTLSTLSHDEECNINFAIRTNVHSSMGLGFRLVGTWSSAHLGPRVVRMISETAFAAVMFPSCADRPVSRLVLMGMTITGALMVILAGQSQRRRYHYHTLQLTRWV